ncbi:MAG TPA: DUF1080 domain-containing protein [Planctomycetaceae bacterium]|nr:DUF1080 domain-containing protein [Planctomycetaceae bacterium]
MNVFDKLRGSLAFVIGVAFMLLSVPGLFTGCRPNISCRQFSACSRLSSTGASSARSLLLGDAIHFLRRSDGQPSGQSGRIDISIDSRMPRWHAAAGARLQQDRCSALRFWEDATVTSKPALLSLFLTLSSTTFVVADDGWQTLFNGKDLTGWRANYYPDSWTVVDGAIRAHATAESSHLFYVGNQPKGKFVAYENFVLELSARGERDSNSGIYFHTDYQTLNRRHHLANGYEVQLDSAPNAKRATGSLYAVVDLEKSAVDESRWFRVRITVKDKHIVIQIDDKTLVEYTEPAHVKRESDKAGRKLSPSGGAIALQGHDPRSTFYFKDIRIKRLP